MKRNNLRNVWPYLIFAMICAALGGFLFYKSQNSSADQFVEQGLIYPKTEALTGHTAVTIKEIIPVLEITITKTKNGVVVSENKNTGLVAYLASDGERAFPVVLHDDSNVLKILKERLEAGQLESNPLNVLALASKGKDDLKIAEKVIDRAGADANVKSRFDDSALLDVAEAENRLNIMLFVSFALGAAVLLLLLTALWKYWKNTKFYSTLYDHFPELAQDLDKLVTDSDFHSPELGLYVYKNHLVVIGGNDRIIDLTQIIYTYAVRQTNNSVVTFQVHLHNNQFRRLVVKPRRYQREFTQAMLDRLMVYLQEAYPSMLVGVQHATDYKELKRQARG
jgi:hypothetical protein